jgi:chromosome segregation ATPase
MLRYAIGQYEDLRTQYGTATSQRDELQAKVEKQLETISNLEQQLTEQAKIVRAQERKQARIEAQYEVQLETARKQIAKLKRSISQSAGTDTDTDSASTNDVSMKEKNGVVLRNKKMERSGKASDGRWAEQQQQQKQTDDPLQSMWEGVLGYY